MSIKKIFGPQMMPPPAKTQGNQKAGSVKPAPGRPVDKVDFSSVLQGLDKAKESSAPADAQRTEKVAALKAQIASGTYRPNLEKVAESLLKFIAEDGKNG